MYIIGSVFLVRNDVYSGNSHVPSLVSGAFTATINSEMKLSSFVSLLNKNLPVKKCDVVSAVCYTLSFFVWRG